MHNQRTTHRFCSAPMLDWTDRHCRFFYRLMSKRTLLYTEMITAGAIIHGDAVGCLAFNAEEHPLACQLGGSNPKELAVCAKVVEDHGYDEINLNVGCPSDKVQNGQFGACLMAHPSLVADCVAAMRESVSIPVTVKSRIGIDDQDSFQALADFVATIADAGCDTLIIHARKAWLQGLSPKQNREIPPLRYDYVYQIKQLFPQLNIVLNGGITDLEQAIAHLNRVDGVMLGREVYHNPYILAQVDSRLFTEVDEPKIRRDIVLAFLPYIQKQLQTGVRLNHITRHILGLFHGEKGARNWRRYLSEHAHQSGADESVVMEALKFTEC